MRIQLISSVKDLAVALVDADGPIAYKSILITLRDEHMYLDEREARHFARTLIALADVWNLGLGKGIDVAAEPSGGDHN